MTFATPLLSLLALLFCTMSHASPGTHAQMATACQSILNLRLLQGIRLLDEAVTNKQRAASLRRASSQLHRLPFSKFGGKALDLVRR